MLALIESEYIRKLLNYEKYIIFLESMLRTSKKNKIKEACCRQIIKYFGKKTTNEQKIEAKPADEVNEG